MTREPLLFLAHRIPYPPDKGDKVRSYHFLRHLAERYRLFLGTFIDDAADLPHRARLEALCAAARSAGALGAKLTGAGGGGCIVAIVPDAKTERAVLDAMSALDAPAWAVTVAG